MPKLYGFAWYDVMRRKAVCYPMPFNLLMNWLRKLYYAIGGPSTPEIEKRLAREYTRGVQAGVQCERKRWKKILDDELERLDKRRTLR